MNPSIKSLAKPGGPLKRKDGYTVEYHELVIEKGFNLRFEDSPRVQEHRQRMLAYLKGGGKFPPLEVRPGPKGEVIVVEGHNRHWVYGEAIKQGVPIGPIHVIPFQGNDLDRTNRIMDAQEGLKLTPLELALGYKRLEAFGQSVQEIAARRGKTPQHVQQLLILAHANNDVHRLVAADKVSAAQAIKIVREHGEDAGRVIQEALDRAEKAGKKKVTAVAITGKKLPPRLVDATIGQLESFVKSVPKSARVAIAEAEAALSEKQDISGRTVQLPAALLVELLGAFSEVEAARKKAADKANTKANRAAQQELPTDSAPTDWAFPSEEDQANWKKLQG